MAKNQNKKHSTSAVVTVDAAAENLAAMQKAAADQQAEADLAAKQKADADAEAAKQEEAAKLAMQQDPNAGLSAAPADPTPATPQRRASDMTVPLTVPVVAARPMQNGVKRPKPEGLCGQAWAVMDEMSFAKGSPVAIADLLVETNKRGLNPGNVRAEYSAWRKFNGVSGRVPPVAQAPAQALQVPVVVDFSGLQQAGLAPATEQPSQPAPQQ